MIIKKMAEKTNNGILKNIWSILKSICKFIIEKLCSLFKGIGSGFDSMDKYLKQKSYFIYYVIATVCFLIVCFQSNVRNIILKYVLPNFTFDYCWVSWVLTVIFIIWFLRKFISLWKIKYIYSHRLIAFLLFLVGTIIYYECKYRGNCALIPMLKYIKYIDLLCGASILFLGEGIRNRFKLKEKKDPKVSEFSDDRAIEGPDEDKLDYKSKAAYIVKKIESLPYSKSTSIAIYSSWGNGKTSFMNLIQNALNDEEYEIIEFSPRQCKNANSIQEEFFNTLVNNLKKYDSSIAFQVNKYISTIGITVSNPIYRIPYLFLKMDNKELRVKINKILIKLEKRVVIFIDDLDRLTGEEIMEVLKLIDKNAAFSNIVFITAFDSGFVGNAISKYIGENDNDTPFINKFFSIRYPLPILPSSIMIYKFKELWKENLKKAEELWKESIEKLNTDLKESAEKSEELENILNALKKLGHKIEKVKEVYDVFEKSNKIYYVIKQFRDVECKLKNINELYDILKKSEEVVCKLKKYNELEIIIKENNRIFWPYLRNIRDVKNFYNQFVADYTFKVANQVSLRDFLLVELIKFRNYDEYLSLSRHKYIVSNNFINSIGCYVLKTEYRDNKNNTKMPKSIDILSILFEKKEKNNEYTYLSIQNKHFFDFYFTLSMPKRIPVSELENLFLIKEPKDIFDKFKKWYDSNILKDVYYYFAFIDYRNIAPMFGMFTQDTFKQYIKIFFLYSAFLEDKNLDIESETDNILIRVLLKSNFNNGYNGLVPTEYHNYLLEVLYNYKDFHYCPIHLLKYLAEKLFNELTNEHEKIESDCIFKKEEIKEHNLLLLKQYVKDNNHYSDITQKLYELCIDKISNNIEHHLPEANQVMLDFLNNDKTYTYLKPFYYDGGGYLEPRHSMHNGDYLKYKFHPFCKEIFNVEPYGDTFLHYVESSDIEDKKKENIITFWKKYIKSNSNIFYGVYKEMPDNPNPSEEEIINGMIF